MRRAGRLSRGVADMSDMNGKPFKKSCMGTRPGRAAATATERAGAVSHFSLAQAVLPVGSAERVNEHNKFLCCIKCRRSALPG